MSRTTGTFCGALLGAHVAHAVAGGAPATWAVGMVIGGAVVAWLERSHPW